MAAACPVAVAAAWPGVGRGAATPPAVDPEEGWEQRRAERPAQVAAAAQTSSSAATFPSSPPSPRSALGHTPEDSPAMVGVAARRVGPVLAPRALGLESRHAQQRAGHTPVGNPAAGACSVARARVGPWAADLVAAADQQEVGPMVQPVSPTQTAAALDWGKQSCTFHTARGRRCWNMCTGHRSRTEAGPGEASLEAPIKKQNWAERAEVLGPCS